MLSDPRTTRLILSIAIPVWQHRILRRHNGVFIVRHQHPSLHHQRRLHPSTLGSDKPISESSALYHRLLHNRNRKRRMHPHTYHAPPSQRKTAGLLCAKEALSHKSITAKLPPEHEAHRQPTRSKLGALVSNGEVDKPRSASRRFTRAARGSH